VNWHICYPPRNRICFFFEFILSPKVCSLLCLDPVRLCSGVLYLLSASESSWPCIDSYCLPPISVGTCISSCFLCFPGRQWKTFNQNCSFLPLQSPTSYWTRAVKGCTWSVGSRRPHRAGCGGSSTSPAYFSYLHNVPAERDGCASNNVGHAWCVVTALLYKSLVTSVQTHSRIVQIV